MTSKLRVALLLTLIAFCSGLLRAQEHPNFSGTWKLDGAQSIPPRNGDVTLKIKHQEPEFTVETTVVHGSAAPRHALQHYTIDGKTSVSTGADGDEFHTSIVWQRQSLAFTIVEHEDGRTLPSTESWSLKEEGKSLERVRQMPGGKQQTLIYLRQP